MIEKQKKENKYSNYDKRIKYQLNFRYEFPAGKH